MGRKATTISEQIQKLKDRGMSFDCDDSKAEEYLLDIGYYRLGFYWNPFEIDNKHNFRKGICFSTIIKLYYLDVDLKYFLMRALNRIEINLRTQIVYSVSNKYQDSPTWFSDSKVMKQKFIDEFPRYYNDKFKENNKPIKAHHRKYLNDIYAPAWKTLEFLTFGSIFNIYLNLKDKGLKKEIATYYGFKKERVFVNYFKTTTFIRNICAHSGLLYDSNTPFAIIPTPLITINNNDRHSLNTAIQVILYFMGRVSLNRKEELKSNIRELFESHKENDEIRGIIETKIGYTYG